MADDQLGDQQTGGSGDQGTTEHGGDNGLPDTVDESLVSYEERGGSGGEQKIVRTDETETK